jgi:hypothetical protein
MLYVRKWPFASFLHNFTFDSVLGSMALPAIASRSDAGGHYEAESHLMYRFDSNTKRNYPL